MEALHLPLSLKYEATLCITLAKLLKKIRDEMEKNQAPKMTVSNPRHTSEVIPEKMNTLD